MKKLFNTILVIAISFVLGLGVTACDSDTETESVETGNLVYELVTDDEEDRSYYKVTGYTVSSDDALKMADGDFSTVEGKREIEIPATYKELPVEEIGMSAFADQVILTKITIPTSIKKIGAGAFNGCTNLTEMSIPFVGESKDAVNSAKLFAYIFGTTSKDEGVTAVEVNNKAFNGNAGSDIVTEDKTTYYIPSSLEKVVITGEIDCINNSAFNGCSMIKTITLPSTIENIYQSAFNGCSSLKEITIPKSVKYIYENAFNSCSAIRKINFDDEAELEDIGDYAFYGCSSLGNNVAIDYELVLPSSVKVIGKGAFCGCTSLKKLDLSTTQITVIKDTTFGGCTALYSAKLKSGTTIYTGAFCGCSELTEGNVENYSACTVQPNAFDF